MIRVVLDATDLIIAAGTGDMNQTSNASIATPHHAASRLARTILAAFVFTFIASRATVYLIMMKAIPDLFLFVGGTHIHHLNYGIFLLSGVGGYLIFVRPTGRHLTAAAAIYGIGLGLTFDEFGMWLHLGGSYWQRASFDAVIIIAALFGLIAAAPSLNRFRTKHWTIAVLLLLASVLFVWITLRAMNVAGTRLGPHFKQLDSTIAQ